MHLVLKKKKLYIGNYKVKCAIGKRGIKNKIKEGDLITPIGEYKIKFVLYRKDRLKNLSTKLKKIIIKKNMGWCDDPSSKKYNQLVYLPFSYSHEKLFIKENIYDIILVLDYNMNPIVKDKGSAIFIHVAKKNYSKTKGCIAVNKFSLLEIIKRLKIRSKVKIFDQK